MASVHAVILNYKRRNNIPRIVDTCLNVPAIDIIHVIDQADPEQQLKFLPRTKRILAMRAPNIGAGRRVSYAARLPCDLVVAIDDDLFLRPAQIAELIQRGIEDRARLHGVWGQLIIQADGAIRISDGVWNVTQPVDILNRAYAFTPRHARDALAIAASVGLAADNLGQVDDILLSFGGERQPMCHDLGSIYECKTSNEPGIAVWKQPGFEETRIEMVQRLRAIGRIWPPAEPPSRS